MRASICGGGASRRSPPRNGDAQVEQRAAACRQLLQMRSPVLQIRIRAHQRNSAFQVSVRAAGQACWLHARGISLCLYGLQNEVAGAAITYSGADARAIPRHARVEVLRVWPRAIRRNTRLTHVERTDEASAESIASRRPRTSNALFSMRPAANAQALRAKHLRHAVGESRLQLRDVGPGNGGRVVSTSGSLSDVCPIRVAIRN